MTKYPYWWLCVIVDVVLYYSSFKFAYAHNWSNPYSLFLFALVVAVIVYPVSIIIWPLLARHEK